MIGAKAVAEAKMNLAGATNVICLLPIFRSMAAVLAISLLCSKLRAVNCSWCIRSWWMPSMLTWLVIS
jgi:hypothetical protein